MSWHQPVESAHHQIKVKGSRFIADIFPITSESEAQAFLGQIQKREHAATHHCFAWRLGIGDAEIFRMNDAGEPAGTAGKPIYNHLVGTEITNIIAIVTRYFGGIKLGKGGLIRAYGGVVRETLATLKTKPFIPLTKLTCTVGFELANVIYRIVQAYNGQVLDQRYSDRVSLIFSVGSDDSEKIQWEIFQATKGQVKVLPIP